VHAVHWTGGAHIIGLLTVAAPAYNGRSYREAYLTQPMVMASASTTRGRASLHFMLNFEGLTLMRGELNPGALGEGYVDRRHPHTYLHELVGTLSGSMWGTALSLAAGKGFVPFGTDDPAVRPFAKYPANHHLAQVIERALLTLAARRGPLLLELARFNGDEPESPSDLPNRERLWDSWSARATAFSLNAVETQVSFARVISPELALGGGTNHRKWSASVRVEPGTQNGRHGAAHRTGYYALAEWAQTNEVDGRQSAFIFRSVLGEVQVNRGRVGIGARFERTSRPEEERLADVFRTARPATDFNILGRTRWDIVSARANTRFMTRTLGTAEPFAEVAYLRPRSELQPSVFEPREFYGSSHLWMCSFGVRLAAGTTHRRTGTYGAAVRVR
jgi:hypothetical protein